MNTFHVSPEVKRAKTLLGFAPSLSAHLASTTSYAVEACGATGPNVVSRSLSNGLLGAVHHAFDQHYPLVLSPDDIWLAIAQAFAIHMEPQAEMLRKHFVKHDGKVEIVCEQPSWQKGLATNPWPDAFSFFSEKIEEHIGKKRDLIVCDFSTTGPIERAASEIVLMGAMKEYFKYRVLTLCGIPEITLLGEKSDWQQVRHKAQALGEFGCAWWTDGLVQILDKFIDASSDRVDTEFWQRIYKEKDDSGGPDVCGWINVFFPYLYDFKKDTYSVVNKAAFGEGLSNSVKRTESMRGYPETASFPGGFTKVPFIWSYLGTHYDMDLLGGFAGVTQDQDSLAVRPSIGWAVRDRPTAPPPGGEDRDNY